MLAAYSMSDPQLPPSNDVPTVSVKCVINLYGPADLALLHYSSGSSDYIQDGLSKYIGGRPTQYAGRYRTVSPISHIGPKTPPTINLLGSSDRLIPVSQGYVLDETLNEAGVAHETYFLPGTDHSFDLNWGSLATQFARAKIEGFLKQHDPPPGLPIEVARRDGN